MLLTNSDYVFPDQSGFAENYIIETFLLFLATFSFIRRTILFNINIWYETSDSQSILWLLFIFLVQLHVQISESEKYSYLRLLILFDNQICFLVQKLFGNHLKISPWKIRSLFNCLSTAILRFLSNNVFSIWIQVSASKTIPYFRLRFGKFFQIPIIFSNSNVFPVFFSLFVKFFLFLFEFPFNHHIKNSVSWSFSYFKLLLFLQITFHFSS